MHKKIYASGFLYHPDSQQILLQQKISATQNSPWLLFGKESNKVKTGEESFKDLFYEVLNIRIKLSNIKIIYSYFSAELFNDNNIYYAEVKNLRKLPISKKLVFSWFTFKQIQKMNISSQTKQDIMVGQRVIESSIRKTLGLRTIG